MRIVAMVSQKGGVGKTTLGGHLAVEADRAGAGPVALLDTDPQGSLVAWWNARTAETPLFVRGGLANLRLQLAELERMGINLVIIDTLPPAITDNIQTVVKFADLVVIPTRPSPHDLRAVGATVDLVESSGKRLEFRA
jgi:chromosome partitioning protein